MPVSDKDGKVETAEWIKKINVKTILDIGPGVGTYANLIKDSNIELDKMDGIEIWEPYVSKYGLIEKYDNVFVADARTWQDFNYDLIIFGDVLEHMTKEEAIDLWQKAKKSAKYAVISIPIVHSHQGEFEGNPYETHVKEDWTTNEVLTTFENIVEHNEYAAIGVFYASFV